MQRIKLILASNGYKYEGPLLHENSEYIVIHDEHSNTEMSFPKNAVIITRTGGPKK